ncbi:hypothetical protein C8A01DRAFT_50715 [Parachaetomium inaequale]|uniref:CCHC-type domain-containing protein n=1 Tax=Parachaetomium inaequale TaxID=2588326 RepID=A0AAN6SMF3_9PEZI|nr:hypothetical protein C8A01DRAFT_50715 [Parachaetomium inaequale]
MSSKAPGQAAPEQEAVCYNCGVKGHWAFACPEPTRDVPVGLQRWQQHKEHGSHERAGSSRDKKGPIVTHYPPPPPSQVTPPVPYGHPPPHPFPPGVPPPPPPPTPPTQGYPHPGYPPNPYPGSYQPQPPPPPPQYGQYPAPPPPPPQYAQHPPYGQPHYAPQYPPAAGYYPPGAAPSPAPPPPSYPPGTYPPQQYAPPPPPPASSPFPPHYHTPPPPGAYQYPPGQPPPYATPAPAGLPYPPPPNWAPSQAGLPPPTPHSANQTPLGTHRGRHQKSHGSKRSQHRERNRHGHEKHGKGNSRNERRGRQPSQDEQQRKPDNAQAKTEDCEPKNQDPKEPVGEKEAKDASGWDPQTEEDLKLAFPETKTNPADPVGIPLPAEYTDDPTIPPAYNATCVKSDFFREDNQKDFTRSIREHPSWATLRDDPVFKHYPGMAMRRFPECEHEYPTYDPSNRPPSSSAIKMPPRFEIDRSAMKAARDRAGHDRRDSRNGHAQPHSPQDHQHRAPGRDRYERDDRDDRRPRKRSLDASPENDLDDRDLKRSRWSQHQRDRSRGNYGRAISPRRRSPSPPKFNLEGDPWSPQAGETNFKASNNRRHHGASNDAKHSPVREERVSYADKRHDSGYQSGQSPVKGASRHRDDERGRRPSDRSHRRRRSPSRTRSPSRSRYRSASRGRSRASTLDRSDRSRSESPLTALEAELLGLAGESSEPEPKPVAKKPIKRVKVAAAFG